LICILLSLYPMASWFHIMEQDELTITRDVIGRLGGEGGWGGGIGGPFSPHSLPPFRSLENVLHH